MDMKEFIDSKVAEKHEIIKINLDKFGNDIGVIEDVDEARQIDAERSEYAKEVYKHKYDHLRNGSPTVIDANGKKILLADVVKKKAKKAVDDAPKKIVRDTLTHLVKMVKGLFDSPMAKDKDFSEFCEESINALIQKETEGLCRLNKISEPNAVYVKKLPIQTEKNTVKVSKNNPLRSNEQFLDCMEIEQMRSLLPQDRESLMNKVFTEFDGTKHMETDHFYRYFVEEMLKSDSKEFAELVKDIDLSNTNINRLKEILRLEKEKLAEEAQKVLDKKRQEDCPFDLENPNCNDRVANSKYEKVLKDSPIHKKLTKKKKVAKKKKASEKTPKKTPKKKAKKKVAKKIITARQKKMADRVTYSELHVPGKKTVIKGTKAKKKVAKKKTTKKKVAKKRSSK